MEQIAAHPKAFGAPLLDVITGDVNYIQTPFPPGECGSALRGPVAQCTSNLVLIALSKRFVRCCMPGEVSFRFVSAIFSYPLIYFCEAKNTIQYNRDL